MKFKLVVRPEVDADLVQAEIWYEEQQAGLGRDFLRAARKKMAHLRRNPFLHRIRQHRKQVRWAYPDRFPYRIIFRIVGDTVVIYAVLHAARDDRHWKRRL